MGSTEISSNTLDTSSFVQTSYPRTTYIKTNIDEDIEMKTQFEIKNLRISVDDKRPPSKA